MQQQVVVTVSSSELKQLTVFPKVLVAGVAGHAYSLVRAAVEYVPGHTAYADPTGTSLRVQVGGVAGSPVDGNIATAPATGFLTGLAGMVQQLSRAFSSDQTPTADLNGADSVLTTNGNGDVTLGDGSLKVTLTYDDLVL